MTFATAGDATNLKPLIREPAADASRAQALDELLRIAVSAVDSLGGLTARLPAADIPAQQLLEQLQASFAAETLAVLQRWPS